jgi:hypothetical protein
VSGEYIYTSTAIVDSVLSTELSSEVSSRLSGDASLSSDLSSEVSARVSGDASLSTGLSSEVSSRLSGDASLSAITTKKVSQITTGTNISYGTGPGMITTTDQYGTQIYIGSLSAPTTLDQVTTTYGTQLGNVNYVTDITLYIPDAMQWNSTNSTGNAAQDVTWQQLS